MSADTTITTNPSFWTSSDITTKNTIKPITQTTSQITESTWQITDTVTQMTETTSKITEYTSTSPSPF